ncbi:hypothetical protein [Pseudomonas avellanae]|uniref:hypothetical protein n=1 Tax=Pseudomonas avellanae TaxID=46257 RepID=UPI000A434084|nr:hypothetical protein [Pseudomonas avellanae]UQW71289.1 hypothetical protein L2Y00_13215 [Pseudomonas avellanae]UQW75365.1 hypothetical protein L2Y01_05890 [Pseudomonas avellanae]GGJ46460.1 hypothetical protein GCM10009085_45080 [Pseudomonas avellanae]
MKKVQAKKTTQKKKTLSNKPGRRQKLSATPDQSGTVNLLYCFRKNQPPTNGKFKSYQ